MLNDLLIVFDRKSLGLDSWIPMMVEVDVLFGNIISADENDGENTG